MKHSLSVCCIFLLTCFLPVTVAGAILPLSAVELLVDAKGVETLESILQPGREQDFQPLQQTFSAGYTRKVHWFRITLPAPESGDSLILAVRPSYLDDLRLYQPVHDQPGVFEEQIQGDLYPLSQREVAWPGFTFRVRFTTPQPQVVYLRLQTSSSSLLTLETWTPRHFFQSRVYDSAFFGLLYGILMMALLSTLLQGLWRKNTLHRAYLVYVFTLLLHYPGSAGFIALLFAEQPWIGHHWVSYAGLLATAGSVRFYQLILDIDRNHPWLLGMCQALLWGSLLGLLLVPLGYYTEVARLISPLTLLVAVFLSWRVLALWQAKSPGSRYMLLAQMISLLGVLCLMLTLTGVFPGNYWLLNAFQIGGILVLLVFGFALSERVRVLEMQRQDAEQRALLAEQQQLFETEARQEQSRFIAMLSHEIKTPLSVISAATDSIKIMLNPWITADTSQRFRRISRSVSRIDLLVEQLLDQDRLDDDNVQLHYQPVQVEAFCQNLLTELEDNKRVRLILHQPLTLEADPALLNIALLNLLHNALKYTPADQPIDLSVMQANKKMTFVVADRGCGINDELKPLIFQRYRRGTKQKDIPGSGLGLYLVQRIALLHQGRVWVDEREGGGSAFHLQLPMRQPPTAEQTS